MKISLIISVFNGEKHISRAIRSCMDQSMQKGDYEIIVVNDGSTDKTSYILDSFKDWIKVINFKKNMGLPYACNAGIKKSLSKFIMRVDSDDYIHRDLLNLTYLFLSMNNDMDAVATDYHIVDDHENINKRISAEKKPIACGVLFRKDYLVDIGLYDEDFLLGEDEDLRIRYLEKYNIYYIPLPLYRYRIHDNNSTKNIKKVKKYRQKLVAKHGLREKKYS